MWAYLFIGDLLARSHCLCFFCLRLLCLEAQVAAQSRTIAELSSNRLEKRSSDTLLDFKADIFDTAKHKFHDGSESLITHVCSSVGSALQEATRHLSICFEIHRKNFLKRIWGSYGASWKRLEAFLAPPGLEDAS